MRKKIINIVNNFVNEVLGKELWFKNMLHNKDCDLLLLTGTALEQSKDKLSDIDLFLICKYEAQIKYSMQPLRFYQYRGEVFELSVLATEKLYNDVTNKENVYWWYNTYIIKNYNRKVAKILRQASRLTNKEFLDRLWTNFVYFEMNTDNINKQIKRNESLSVKLLFNENIKLLMDSILSTQNKFPVTKHFGNALRQVDKKLYGKIIVALEINNLRQLQSCNKRLRSRMIAVLKNNGFTTKEIKNWESCNLKRITFQYR